MHNVLKEWYQRNLTNPEVVILLFGLVFIILAFMFFGNMLAPVFASVVVAYLLDGLVVKLTHFKIPHLLAVILVYLFFLGTVVISLFILLPLLWQQASNLIQELPSMISKGQTLLMGLPERYPDFITQETLNNFIATAKTSMGKVGQFVLSISLASLPGFVSIIVYLVLSPLMVFFFLKDKVKILNWLSQFLPKNRGIMSDVWRQVNDELGKYIRGRLLELVIVFIVTYIAFVIMHLNFGFLLAFLVGLSTILPYIGVVVVTIPVVIIAFLQWGLTAPFAHLIIVYAIIVTLDGNLLGPILFSEAVSIHPVAIIIAILVFGGLWGFWGVFFAIPLASVVKAIINAWPRRGTGLLLKENQI